MHLPAGSAAHWDDAYRAGDASRSWFQRAAEPSLAMFDAAAVAPGAAVVDVGGGASRLVDALLARGFRDVTVLDISGAALETARTRLGHAADKVHWLTADVLTWRPERTWDVWHDRAVLHFFADEAARATYVDVLTAATRPGSTAIIATFAPDGPDSCSGLAVRRYAVGELTALLGDSWQLVEDRREVHTTPSGNAQPFTWAAFVRT